MGKLNEGSKVVNLCAADWANFSYDNAMALRSVGVDCQSYKLEKHIFGYTEQSQQVKISQIRVLCKDADVIQIFHSDYEIYEKVRGLRNKRIYVWHTGTKYRQDPRKYNSLFNGCNIIVALGEFMATAPEGARYIVGAIDTDKYLPSYPTNKNMVFRHHPSNAKVKGTRMIVNMMKRYRAKCRFYFKVSAKILPHHLHMARLDDCDAYIEMFADMQNDKPYGSWGISTLEVAALGKIVITNHATIDVYKAVYGDPELQVVETPQDFYDTLDYLTGLDVTERLDLMHKTRQWVVKNHSYDSAGEFLKEIL